MMYYSWRLIICLCLCFWSLPALVQAQTLPLISRNLPAYASSALRPASYANDSNYSTEWESNGSAWLAYDLSSLDPGQRQEVVLHWFTRNVNYFDTTNLPTTTLCSAPAAYLIEANRTLGGTVPPANGWETLVTVDQNKFSNRQHPLILEGYNWIRLNSTATSACTNNHMLLNMDIYTAPNILADSWFFAGDSISNDAMEHVTEGSFISFSQLVNTRYPNRFPLQVNAGSDGAKSNVALQNIDQWLADFPGKFVVLAYGTNDAGADPTPANLSAYYNNLHELAVKIVNAGKIPLVPKIPWCGPATYSNCKTNAPIFNQQIDLLYQNVPQILPGPDFYTLFYNHAEYLSDGLHPTSTGSMVYRTAWVDVIAATVYDRPTPLPTPMEYDYDLNQNLDVIDQFFLKDHFNRLLREEKVDIFSYNHFTSNV